MRRVCGVVCMVLGAALLAGALMLLLWNRAEADRAEELSKAVVPMLDAAISERKKQKVMASVEPEASTEWLPPVEQTMTEVEIDGHSYIGYLSIPSRDLELPVMSQWSDSKLKIAPCRFSGSTMEENLVVVGHNYRRHFRPIHQLQPGDEVLFTDMDGNVTAYQVIITDVVSPDSAEEVASGFFDLALVTCTYGGKTRLVVYCNAFEKEAY